MDNSAMYKEIMDKAFLDIRSSIDDKPISPKIKEAYKDREEAKKHFLFDFSSDEYNTYSFILNQINHIVGTMIQEILIYLFEIKGLKTEIIPEENVIGITVEHSKERTLFIIKRLNQKKYVNITNTELMNKYNIKKCMVIKFSDTPSKVNTGDSLFYSIHSIFETYFGEDEYEVFKIYADDFSRKVKAYFSYDIIKKLSPNEMYNFKREVIKRIRNYPYENLLHDSLKNQRDQISIIKEQYFDKGYYKAILGHCDFAESFITAERLYDSLKDFGRIDLTTIVMGYYKSIEQLLRHYVFLHKNENRTICLKRNKIFINDKNIDFIMNNSTFGNLKSFLRFNNKSNNERYKSNRDLFRNGINLRTCSHRKRMI